MKGNLPVLRRVGGWSGSSVLRLSFILTFYIFAAAAQASSGPQPDRIVLDGKSLTIDQVFLVARNNVLTD
jgi:hypothetical protein